MDHVQVHVTGFCRLDAGAATDGYAPPAELEAFLAAGPPPVYIGFGSMTLPDVQARPRGRLGGSCIGSGSRLLFLISSISSCPHSSCPVRISCCMKMYVSMAIYRKAAAGGVR